MQPQLAGNTLQTCRKPDFEPGIRPCFAGVNTSCGKIGAETELTKN